MAITRKSWYGIAREATPGTPIANPTMLVAAKGVLKHERNREYSTEERGTRDTNYSVQYTTRKAAADFKGNVYVDQLPYFLLGAMGTLVSSQPDVTHAPTVYKHAMTLSDLPPSMTVTKSYDAQAYQMAQSYVEKLTLKLNAEKVFEMDSTLMGKFPIKTTPTVPAFTTTSPIAGYGASLTFGVSGVSSLDILDFQFDYTQKLVPWYSASGSPDYATMYVGERIAKLDFTARFDIQTFMDIFSGQGTYSNPTDDSLIFDIKGIQLNPGNTPAQYAEVNLGFPLLNYDTVEPDLGKENVLVKVKATVRPGTTANTLMNAYVQNTTTGFTV